MTSKELGLLWRSLSGTCPVSWPLHALHGEWSEKASNPPIPEKTETMHSVPGRQDGSRGLLCASLFGNWRKIRNCGCSILGATGGRRQFTQNRSGLPALLRSHLVGGPQHHPHARFVLVEIWEIFFWSFWRRGRVLNGDFILAYPNATLASNQMNSSSQKQTERWLAHAFPDSSSARHPAAPTPSTLLFIFALLHGDYTLYLKKKYLCDFYELLLLVFTNVSWYMLKKNCKADPIVPLFKTLLWVPIDHRITSRSFFSPNRPTSPAFTYHTSPCYSPTHSSSTGLLSLLRAVCASLPQRICACFSFCVQPTF